MKNTGIFHSCENTTSEPLNITFIQVVNITSNHEYCIILKEVRDQAIEPVPTRYVLAGGQDIYEAGWRGGQGIYEAEKI